jgi:LmeA-like phospholipid-binding
MVTRHRTGWIFLILVLVAALLLAFGLYAVDRLAEKRVADRVADNLQSALGTNDPPQVSFDGFPFLTQIASRNIRQVKVIADGIGTTREGLLPITHADLLITDVTTTDWFQTMTASHIDGSAVVEYSALQEASGIPVSYAGDGRIRIETTTTLFGARVVAQITGVPRLDRSQAITLGDPTITVASVELPDFTAEAMLRTVLKPIPVTGLPLGLTLSSIAADPSAMRLGLVGDNVPLQG